MQLSVLVAMENPKYILLLSDSASRLREGAASHVYAGHAIGAYCVRWLCVVNQVSSSNTAPARDVPTAVLYQILIHTEPHILVLLTVCKIRIPSRRHASR